MQKKILVLFVLFSFTSANAVRRYRANSEREAEAAIKDSLFMEYAECINPQKEEKKIYEQCSKTDDYIECRFIARKAMFEQLKSQCQTKKERFEQALNSWGKKYNERESFKCVDYYTGKELPRPHCLQLHEMATVHYADQYFKARKKHFQCVQKNKKKDPTKCERHLFGDYCTPCKKEYDLWEKALWMCQKAYDIESAKRGSHFPAPLWD